jgi:hypothetical protein
MDRSQIIALYQNFDYSVAAALYVKHGKNETLKGLLISVTPYTERKLKEWIDALAENINAQKNEIENNVFQEKKTTDYQVKIYPPEHILFPYIKKRNEAYREKNYLFSNLYHFKSDEERKLAAFKILDLRNEINEIYELIEVYEKTGTVPKQKEKFEDKAIPENIAEAFQRMTNLKRYIRRYKQNGKDTAELEIELKNIKQHLNLI